MHEGRAFLWRRDAGRAQTKLVEYGPTSEGEAAEKWHRSVFFHLLETGGSLFRVRFHAGQTADFPTIARMRDEGMSDVVAMITRFPSSGTIGEMDCLNSYWATDHPDGFDDAHVEAIAALMPMLALAVKCVSLAHRGDARRNLSRSRPRPARPRRVDPTRRRRQDQRRDLREFTRISERAAPEQIIPLLNDYAEAVISAIYDNGLKLIGDGTLAIFAAPSAEASLSQRDRVA